ncbi:MAG: LysM peptidoglycan-binding domain-containing protein [Salibacteraceae bacterium]
MFLKNTILFSSFVIAFSMQIFATETDTTHSNTFVIDKGDEVVYTLDHMARIPYLEMSEFDTSVANLNVYGYPSDSVPIFDSAHYATILDSMDQLTPFDLVYNDRTAAFIRLYSIKRRKQTARLLGLQHYYFPMMEEMLAKYEMPLELKYLAVIESGLNPKARSHAGAVGLWQFMYATGKMHGLHQNSYMDERMDPIKSTDAACRYLKYLYKMYNKWDLALAAYNCGPGNVNRAMRRSGSTDGNYWDLYPYLPRETRGYVPAFIAVNYVMNNASAHNIYPVMPKSTYFEMDTVHVSQFIEFDQLAKNLDMQVGDIAYFNPTYKLNTIPAYNNKTSILYLPHQKAQLFVQNEDSIYALAKKEKPNQGKTVKKFSEDRVVYTVRSGDYLGKIANRYRVSVSSIMKWNGLRSNKLRIGQKLVIYPSSKYKAVTKTKSSTPKKVVTTKNAKYAYYKIQRGDTLWDIAKTQNVSIENLKSWNHNLSEKNLKVGTKIIIGTV